MILDDNDSDEATIGNKAEITSGNIDINTERIEQNTSLYNAFVTSELASLGLCKQHGMPSAPAQSQSRTLLQSSKLLQDQTNQQDIDNITQSILVESTLHFLPKPSDSGDYG